MIFYELDQLVRRLELDQLCQPPLSISPKPTSPAIHTGSHILLLNRVRLRPVAPPQSIIRKQKHYRHITQPTLWEAPVIPDHFTVHQTEQSSASEPTTS